MYNYLYMHMYIYDVCDILMEHGWMDGWMDGRREGWMDTDGLLNRLWQGLR